MNRMLMAITAGVIVLGIFKINDVKADSNDEIFSICKSYKNGSQLCWEVKGLADEVRRIESESEFFKIEIYSKSTGTTTATCTPNQLNKEGIKK